MRRRGRRTTAAARCWLGRSLRNRAGTARTRSGRARRAVRVIHRGLRLSCWSDGRLNDDPVRPQTERNAERPCGTREQPRDQRTAGGGDREQERCNYPLRSLHACLFPA